MSKGHTHVNKFFKKAVVGCVQKWDRDDHREEEGGTRARQESTVGSLVSIVQALGLYYHLRIPHFIKVLKHSHGATKCITINSERGNELLPRNAKWIKSQQSQTTLKQFNFLESDTSAFWKHDLQSRPALSLMWLPETLVYLLLHNS